MIKCFRVLFRMNPELIIDFYDDDLTVIQQFLNDLAFKFLGHGECWIQSKNDLNDYLMAYYNNQVIKAKKQYGIIKSLY